MTGGGECGSFPFVSPDTQQLFPNRVFGGKTVFNVRFKERLISNAALCEIPAVVPVQVPQSFGCDDVETPLSLIGNGSMKPVLLNPENNLGFPNMKRARQAFHGKEITPDFAQAETISPKHVADRFGRPVDLLRYLFNRSFHEFFTNRFDFGLSPSSVVLPSLDPMLDDETPASFLGAT
jgi:hypothetical protein